MLAELPRRQGVGKLLSADSERCTVSVFHSILRSESVDLPLADVGRAFLSPQTRVYVQDGDHYRIGRVKNYFLHDNGLVDYEVRFPNGRQADISELALYVRPWSAPEDPAEILASGGAESQYLHDRRQAATGPLLQLRRATQGMSALVSAGIELVPHQIAAVRRILADPVQRYLLADEVGLGKTIEAGLVGRRAMCSPGGCPIPRTPGSAPRPWRKHWLATVRRRS